MRAEKKGASYVAIQLLLITAYFLTPNPLWFAVPAPVKWIAATAAFIGLALTLIASLQLNTQLSPFPSPRDNAHLIQTKAYKYIRHPIYTGIFLFGAGWAIHNGNLTKLAIAFALLALLYKKARLEEEILEKSFPNYSAYKTKTGMLFPKCSRQ